MTSFCENVARGACENPSRRPTKSELNDAILVYASASEDVMKVPTPVGVNRALDAAQRHVIELLDALYSAPPALTDERMRQVAKAIAARVGKTTSSNPNVCFPGILLTLQEMFAFAPATCAMCNDSGIVGSAPDNYFDCADCAKARAGTLAASGATA